MTIQDIGSIGELLAAIAMIVTIVYLAAQIRHATTATKTSNYLDLTSRAAALGGMCAQDPELSDVYLRALDGYSGLPDGERARAFMAINYQMTTIQTIFELQEAGLIPEAEATTYSTRTLQRLLAMPRIQE